jgi:hypothetical protein
VTSEIEFELTPRVELELAIHFERNDSTADIHGDERKGEHESASF